MPRRLFLSFLGTNNYVACNYYDEAAPELRVENVSYVQEALIQMYCKDFGPEDRYCFFLTEKARKMNWENDGQWNRETGKYDLPNEGLASRLESLSLQSEVLTVDIPEGFSSEEIWEIFDRVFGCIGEGDEVYLDITHAFRFFPLLGMVLLNYAKVLKNIQVRGIYYGAFEKLGPTGQVKNMPIENRNAPVLNLLSVSELQDWTNAAREFVKYGKVSHLSELMSKKLNPILAETKGKDEVARRLREVGAIAEDMARAIATNRGEKIYREINFDTLKRYLCDFAEQSSFIRPLNPIMEVLAEKVEPFQKEDPLHWLKSARWCVDHAMYQQAITQLQEGILTWLCMRLRPASDFFDWQKEAPRNLLSSVFSIISQKKEEREWKGEAGVHSYLTRVLVSHPFLQSLARIFSPLQQLRNDVNHGGYKEDSSKASKVISQCETLIAKLEELEWPERIDLKFHLVNLSNHPTRSWSKEQMAEAERLFGRVIDMPFPAVPPEADEAELEALVEEYFHKIMEIKPAAVHVMGEMTFTCRLVAKLKARGITCLASTTQRVAREVDGKKISEFHFRRFRKY